MADFETDLATDLATDLETLVFDLSFFEVALTRNAFFGDAMEHPVG